MVDESHIVKNKRNLKIIIVIIILVGIVCVAAIALSNNLGIYATMDKKEYSTTFKSVTASVAYDLVYNNSPPIFIVDINNCECAYKDRHIPGAIWETNITPFYDFTLDILVYCEDDNLSRAFCEDLVGHTFGDIYYLEGGIKVWEDAGYKTTKVEPPKRNEP